MTSTATRDLAEIGSLIAAGVVPVLAYAALGLGIARRLGLGHDRLETAAHAYLLGSGIASLVILALRLVEAPIPLWSLGFVAVAGAAASRSAGGRPQTAAAREAPRWARVLDGVAISLAVLTVLAALAPETYWDGFEYHLPMIAAWCAGPIRALPGLLDAELRAGIDLLYVPAVMAGRPDAAAAVTAGFALCLAVLVRGEVRRRATPGAAAIATTFVLLVPFTRDNAPSSYVDLGVGAYGFLALLCIDRWNRGADGRAALTAAALGLAFAANAKLHAAALVPAALALATFGGRRPATRDLIRCAAAVAVLCAPWLAKSWLTSGNPLFPLLVAQLGPDGASEAHLALRRFRLSTDFPEPRSVASFLRYVASLPFGHNPHFSGLLGALPFALLPAAIGRMQRATAVLLAVLVVLFGLQFVFMPALRFGAPLLPFVAIAAAVGGARLAAAGPWAARALGVAIALLGLHHAAAFAVDYGPRLRALRDPAAYRAQTFPGQIVLAEMVADGAGVVAIPKGAVLWMPRPVYVLHWERNGELFFDRVLGRRTPPDEALALMHRRGVGTVILERPEAGLPRDRTGHATVDAWIASGRAARRVDVAPRASRPGHVYVRVDLR